MRRRPLDPSADTKYTHRCTSLQILWKVEASRYRTCFWSRISPTGCVRSDGFLKPCLLWDAVSRLGPNKAKHVKIPRRNGSPQRFDAQALWTFQKPRLTQAAGPEKWEAEQTFATFFPGASSDKLIVRWVPISPEALREAPRRKSLLATRDLCDVVPAHTLVVPKPWAHPAG